MKLFFHAVISDRARFSLKVEKALNGSSLGSVSGILPFVLFVNTIVLAFKSFWEPGHLALAETYMSLCF